MAAIESAPDREIDALTLKQLELRPAAHLWPIWAIAAHRGYSPQQCKDHTLIDVTVGAGQTVTGINPNDYYIDPKKAPAEPGTA